MKEFLTSHDIANQIRMTRPMFDGVIIIVEGDSDARVYKRFISEQGRVVPAHGKTNALNAMEMIEGSGVEGVFAIVDSDFWALDGLVPPGKNVLVTDTHDLETMIMSSGAFNTIIGEFGSDRKVRRLGGDVRKMLVDTALPIGFIRWISSTNQEKLGLSFKDISFDSIVEFNGSVMKTNIDSLLREIRGNSNHAEINVRDMKIRLRRLMNNTAYDPWHVCRGHDLVHIFAIGLRNVFGNRHAKAITYDQIDRILRISYGYSDFAKTRLFASITLWEKAHPAFKVLPE